MIPNFPITTNKAREFWESKHKLNRAKAIIAFSLDEDNANDNLRRHGEINHFRKRLLRNYKQYVNNPKMDNIPFSPVNNKPWYEELTIP